MTAAPHAEAAELAAEIHRLYPGRHALLLGGRRAFQGAACPAPCRHAPQPPPAL